MEDKPSSVLQRFFEEIRAGNPLIIILILVLAVALSSVWVWQTIQNPAVNTPTPRFRHSTVVSPIKALTARALTQVPQASGTPAAALLPSPLVAVTPQAAFFHTEKINRDE